jgi:hypothetical protein
MALTKESYVDQITVLENGTVLIREITKIIEDDVELTKQYHRSSILKNSDLSNQPKQVQDICAAAWKG